MSSSNRIERTRFLGTKKPVQEQSRIEQLLLQLLPNWLLKYIRQHSEHYYHYPEKEKGISLTGGKSHEDMPAWDIKQTLFDFRFRRYAINDLTVLNLFLVSTNYSLLILFYVPVHLAIYQQMTVNMSEVIGSGILFSYTLVLTVLLFFRHWYYLGLMFFLLYFHFQGFTSGLKSADHLHLLDTWGLFWAFSPVLLMSVIYAFPFTAFASSLGLITFYLATTISYAVWDLNTEPWITWLICTLTGAGIILYGWNIILRNLNNPNHQPKHRP